MNQLSRAIVGVTVTPILFATLVIGLLFAGAGAASPSQEECEANGGTFSKVNGEVQCATNVGNSPNSQTTDSGGQGNIGNKSTCSGPGDSTAKCP